MLASNDVPTRLDQTSPDVLIDGLSKCRRDEDIQVAFVTIGMRYGFDGLSYIVVGDAAGLPVLSQHWTFAGARWRARYADRQMHLADPRVLMTQGRSVPVCWHNRPEVGSAFCGEFVREAERYRICSGVAHGFDDLRLGRVIVAWDSVDPNPDRELRWQQLPALVYLDAKIHEAMLDHCRRSLAERPGPRLTERERECVSYAARGMTSADIGAKLGITERTVNFHFGNITAKLGVLNRAEAIVRALSLRVI